MYKVYSTESATILYAQFTTTVIVITSVICKEGRENLKRDRKWYSTEYSVSKWLLQKPSKSVCAHAVTSIKVQLRQCYDTVIINIYAALYSLQSTSTFIIMFDICPLSRRSIPQCQPSLWPVPRWVTPGWVYIPSAKVGADTTSECRYMEQLCDENHLHSLDRGCFPRILTSCAFVCNFHSSQTASSTKPYWCLMLDYN